MAEWNAATNSPALASGTGIANSFYFITVSGTTTIDGTSSWTTGNVILCSKITGGVKWIQMNGGLFASLISTSSPTTINGMVKGNGATLAVAVAGTDYQAPLTVPATPTPGDLVVWGANNQILADGGAVPTGGGGGMTNPMSAAGDMIAGGASGVPARLAGNTSTTPEILTSTGTGSAANAPAWQSLSSLGIAVLSLLTAVGDTIYASASGVWQRLAGNTSTNTMLMTSTGTGSAATAPAWGVQLVQSVGSPGSSTNVPSEAGVRSAIASASSYTGSWLPPCKTMRLNGDGGDTSGQLILIAGTGAGLFAGYSNAIATVSGTSSAAIFTDGFETGSSWAGGSYETTQVYAGSKAYEVGMNLTGSLLITGLIPNQAYTFTAYVYCSGAASASISVSVNGTTISTLPSSTTSAWVQLTASFTTSPGVTSVTLDLNGPTVSGVAYFDNVSVQPVSAPTYTFAALAAGNAVMAEDTGYIYSYTGTLCIIEGAQPYFPNSLANGGFDFNQRQLGLGALASGSYGFDRWYALSQTGNITNSQVAGPTTVLNAGRFSQAQSTAQRFGIVQPLENINSVPLRGQPLMLQGQLRSSVAGAVIHFAVLEWQGTADSITKNVISSWTNTTFATGNFFTSTNLAVTAYGSVTLSSANTWYPFSLAATPSTSMNNCLVMIWTDAAMAQNATLDITACDLFPGITTRAWTPRDTQQELALCQRWYEKSYDLGVAPGTNTETGAIDCYIGTASTSYIGYTAQFFVPKRIDPTTTTIYDIAGNAGKITYANVGNNEAIGNSVVSQRSLYLNSDNTTANKEGISFHYTVDASL